MKAQHTADPNRIVRTAAWLYVMPRLLVGAVLVAVLGLTAFLICISIARTWLLRSGA
jgi:ABC-type dipeptide/oligopeptide/nickel transport system permease subunit